MRATQLPKACPTMIAGPPRSCHDGSDVAGEIVQRKPCHWSAAAAGAARLRPQNTKAAFGQPLGDLVKIFGATAARRQHHDRRPVPFRDHSMRTSSSAKISRTGSACAAATHSAVNAETMAATRRLKLTPPGESVGHSCR